MRRRQYGVALVTALLVVALATVAAVAMTSRQQIDIRRTQNLLESEQLRFYMYGVEAWAGRVLEQDRKDSTIDHLGEDWAIQLPPIPLDNGQVSGHMEDVQARFNLNNLIDGGKVSAEDLARLRRLLVVLELEPNLAETITDWIDDNIEPWPPSGAEDDIYLGRQPPYRAANRFMGDVSELMLIAGFDTDSYRILAPYVSALPGRSSINLNTAPVPILMSLAEGLSQSDVEQFVADREEAGFKTIDEALKHPAFAERKIAREGLDVATAHFVVMSTISVGRLQQRFASLLARDNSGAVRLLSRTQLYL